MQRRDNLIAAEWELQFVRDGYGESFWRYFGNKKWEKSENG